MGRIYHPTDFLEIVESGGELILPTTHVGVRPDESIEAELKPEYGDSHIGLFAVDSVLLRGNMAHAVLTHGSEPKRVEFDTPDEFTQFGVIANPALASQSSKCLQHINGA